MITSTILAAGPLVLALGAVFGPILCGLAFSVLSITSFNGVQEDLNNPKPNPHHAIYRGYSHLLMCSIVFASLMVVSPFLGPFAPVIPGLFAGFMLITALSALCNGGYAHLHETWSKTRGKYIIWFFDKILSFIPSRIRSFLGNMFSKIHPWLGPFFLTTQIGLFLAIAIAISPPLGIAGLAYFGLELARSQNKLPIFMGGIAEKFRGVMEVISGFFTNNNILHLYSTYKVISASLLYLSSYPWSVKNAAVKPPATISISGKEDINSGELDALQKIIPRFKLATELHKDGMGKDVEIVFSDYEQYCNRYKKSIIELRKRDYTQFQKLRTSLSIFDKAKYYLGYIPMNLREYLPITGYYNPRMFNAYCQEVVLKRPIGITENHMEQGQVVMPTPAVVDFSRFTKLAMNKVTAENRIESVKPILDNLINFTELKTKNAAAMMAEIESKGLNLEDIKQEIDDLDFEILALDRLNKFRSTNSKIFDEILQELCDKEKTVELLNNKNPMKKNRDQYKQIYTILYSDPNSTIMDIDTARIAVDKAISMPATNALLDRKDQLEQQRGTKLDTKFYLDFFESRIKVFCDKVRLGNVAWDKSVTSVELWQYKSKHLINYITDLLESGDEQKIALAFSVLSCLVEATDECAESLFTVVEKFYYNLVKPKFILDQLDRKEMTAKDLVYINMTHIRNTVFDKLYGMLPTHDGIKGFFFFMDFSDKHDQSYIRRATQPVLHLSSDDGLTSGDLSRKNLDVLKELGARSISWLGYRLLTACEQEGYSVDGIIMEMWEQFKNHNIQPFSMQDKVCPVAFNAYSCLRRWADDLPNHGIKDRINSILDEAIKIELDTVKLIKNLSASKNTIGKYIKDKIDKVGTNNFLNDLSSPEEDDDKVQEYIMRMLRNVSNNVESLSDMIYGLKHCKHENVRNYVNKRVNSNADGIYEVDLNKFLSELKEFQSNKIIRSSIRAEINLQNTMELQIKSLMALMLIDTGVFEINSPEIKDSFKKILGDELCVSKINTDLEPVVDPKPPVVVPKSVVAQSEPVVTPKATVVEPEPVVVHKTTKNMLPKTLLWYVKEQEEKFLKKLATEDSKRRSKNRYSSPWVGIKQKG